MESALVAATSIESRDLFAEPQLSAVRRTLPHCMTTVGVVGLGYVGLPLAVAFAREGCEVVAVDVDPRKVQAIAAASPTSRTSPPRSSGRSRERIHADTRYARLERADAVLICVPTPLTRNREPDLGPLIDSTRGLADVAAGGPAGGARVHDLPGHDARAGATDPRGVGPGRRPRLPPGLLARARRPGAHGLHVAQHAEGRRWADGGLRGSRARRCTSWCATRS